MVENRSDNLNIIGVIHARGGSVRVPLKDIKPVNGKPLISYMINAALGTLSPSSPDSTSTVSIRSRSAAFAVSFTVERSVPAIASTVAGSSSIT